MTKLYRLSFQPLYVVATDSLTPAHVEYLVWQQIDKGKVDLFNWMEELPEDAVPQDKRMGNTVDLT
jgi:hypothetical protein